MRICRNGTTTTQAALSFSAWFNTTAGGVILGQTDDSTAPGGAAPSGWVPAVYVGTDGRVYASLFWHGFNTQLVSAGAYNVLISHVSTALAPNPRPPGTVLEQEPGAGSVVDEGATVNLSVSSGPGLGTVPKVVGQPVDDAVKSLRAKGFRARVTHKFSDRPKGDVIAQDPGAGARPESGGPYPNSGLSVSRWAGSPGCGEAPRLRHGARRHGRSTHRGRRRTRPRPR